MLVGSIVNALKRWYLPGAESRWSRRKPAVLLLVDYKNWAFENCARQIAKQLRRQFRFTIQPVHSQPVLNAAAYDLIYVFFWGEQYHRQFCFDPGATLKEVSSHRWEDDPSYGPCSPAEMVAKYLSDAGTVVCTSRRLYEIVRPYHSRVFHAPNGIDPTRFRRLRERRGPLTIGWAGDIEDPVKGINDVIKPACEGRFRLQLAPGGLSHRRMNDFYNQLDVIAVASKHEGSPLPLLEAMAAGCFPVCVDVGIVPELVVHGKNGLIVPERTAAAFRAAFAWCENNAEAVRAAGARNAVLVRNERNWQRCAQSFKRCFLDAISYARRARFRNDDISADTSLERLRQFCDIFRKYGIAQVHGVTLRGRTNSCFVHGSDSVQYPGYPDIGKVPNCLIRELSDRDAMRFENRTDLIDWLHESPDEIALHGLYHVDYSVMTLDEQRRDMEEGLVLLRRLFTRKQLRYFIAPFNRTNADTYRAAAGLGLTVLAADGIHLEENLQHLEIVPKTWYRYHHHRFYPESTARYHNLSFEILEAALARNAARLQFVNPACASAEEALDV